MDDEIGEVEPFVLHDKDFRKEEEGVDVEINETTMSQSVKLVNMFTLYEELSKINHENSLGLFMVEFERTRNGLTEFHKEKIIR